VAPPPGTLRVGRYFLALLLLLIALYSLIVFPGQRHTPKLGIDLVGGLRVVFTAITPKGAPPPTSSEMSQARQIMEDRINTYGVTGATVVVQGSNQLVIEIPSGTGADVDKLGKAAVLNFRGIMAPAQPVACSGHSPYGGTRFAVPASDTVTVDSVRTAFTDAKATLSGRIISVDAGGKPQIVASVANTATTDVSPDQATTIQTAVAKSLGVTSSDISTSPLCATDPFKAVLNDDKTSAADKQALTPLLTQQLSDQPSGLNAESCPSPSMPTINDKPVACHAFSDLSPTQQTAVLGALPNFDCSAAQGELDLAYSYYLACDQSGYVFLLGHIVVHGTDIKAADAQAPNIGGGRTEWTVALTLNSGGADRWHDWTKAFNTQSTTGTPLQQGTGAAPCGASAALPCSDFVAFTLDGGVLTFPVTHAVLSVNTEISGGFTQSSANSLAQELSYGKLSVSFKIEENNRVSATLGNKQLKAAFIAGGIGLVLVVIYSLLYYRALGLVTIASLLVSALLTYAMLVILATQIGFTLDLAGIAGFIVALGITADSFVVFFERIKDEVHEGRSMRVAVPRAWIRARRTILSADTVSFLAAAILYYFASAEVKGFAFTLGMSTILDLVVVFLFTHPLVSLLSRSASFGSARMSGLAALRTGGVIADDAPAAARRRPPARRERVKRTEQPAAVAVLDENQDVDEDAGLADDSPDEPVAPTESEQPRLAPEPGTAAERAAARRARMREQGDGKETR
jgi:preprotein translocase subunit SecD